MTADYARMRAPPVARDVKKLHHIPLDFVAVKQSG